MKTDVKIDPKDLQKLSEKIQSLKKYAGRELSNEIGKTAFGIERRAKRKVVKDKSGLVQSIKSTHSGKKAFVEAGKKYAPYVEFGTGEKVDLTDMQKLGIPDSYALQFKGKGIKEINLPARPFLFPSARIEFLNLLKRIQERFKEII